MSEGKQPGSVENGETLATTGSWTFAPAICSVRVRVPSTWVGKELYFTEQRSYVSLAVVLDWEWAFWASVRTRVNSVS